MVVMVDGFPTTLALADLPSVKFYVKAIKPPDVDGGGEIDISTMTNTAWRTRAPKSLKTLGEMTISASYDAEVYDDIIGANGVNNNQLFTITFPDTSTLAFWGWINTFSPPEHEEGEQPVAEVGIICSNRNDSGVETAPVFTGA